MGESIGGGMFGGGDDTKTINYPGLTARNQRIADSNAQQKFIKSYTNLFASPTSNPGMAESLSGYFNGKSIPEIAAMLARTNAFMPKVKPVTQEVKTKGGGSFMDLIPSPFNPIPGVTPNLDPKADLFKRVTNNEI